MPVTVVLGKLLPRHTGGPDYDNPGLCAGPALHGFRFIGLAFLVPGVVSPELPSAFARPAAYGDLLAAALALLALAALRSPLGIGLVWVFNLVGTADLLHAIYLGRIGVGVEPGQLGAAYFIPTVVVPLLLVTHGLVFRLLLARDDAQ